MSLPFFFHLNSARREDDAPSATDSDFYTLIEVPKDGRRFNRVTVEQVDVPKSFYNVPLGSSFILHEGASQATVTLQEGTYSFRSLYTELTTKLSDASATMGALPNHSWTYVVTYPGESWTKVDTGKFLFAVSGNNSQPSLEFGTQLYEQCGFKKNSTIAFVGDELDSTNVMKLQKEDTVFIHSDVCSNASNNVLQAIFGNANEAYSSIIWQNPDPDGSAKLFNSTGGNTFHFYLTDENNAPLRMNGLNWNAELKFFFDPIPELIKEARQFKDVILMFIAAMTEVEEAKLEEEERVEEVEEAAQPDATMATAKEARAAEAAKAAGAVTAPVTGAELKEAEALYDTAKESGDFEEGQGATVPPQPPTRAEMREAEITLRGLKRK